MKLETNNENVEFYLASLALGLLEGMKQGVIHPEVGIWSLARTSFSNEILKSPIISNDLKYVIECMDEIDIWISFENGKVKQQKMINELKEKCIACLKKIKKNEIGMQIVASMIECDKNWK